MIIKMKKLFCSFKKNDDAVLIVIVVVKYDMILFFELSTVTVKTHKEVRDQKMIIIFFRVCVWPYKRMVHNLVKSCGSPAKNRQKSCCETFHLLYTHTHHIIIQSEEVRDTDR